MSLAASHDCMAKNFMTSQTPTHASCDHEPAKPFCKADAPRRGSGLMTVPGLGNMALRAADGPASCLPCEPDAFRPCQYFWMHGKFEACIGSMYGHDCLDEAIPGIHAGLSGIHAGLYFHSSHFTCRASLARIFSFVMHSAIKKNMVEIIFLYYKILVSHGY